MDLGTTVVRLPDVLARELARALESAIIFGDLPPDARLTEEELAQRYRVSRSPVREALRLLEQDGLVLREARRGFWVAPMSRRDLDEVYSCRVALEGLAAEQAAQARTPAGVSELRSCLGALAKAAGDGDVRSYFRENVRMTSQIHAMAGNETLRRLLDSIGKQALRYRFLAYSRSPELIAMSLAGNEQIVEAIAKGRPEAARLVTERLIRRSWKAMTRAFSADAASKQAG